MVFPRAGYFGDTIRVRGEVVHKEVRARGRRGEVAWRRQVVNQEGKVVQEGVVVTLVEGRGGRGTPAKAETAPADSSASQPAEPRP